MFINLIQKSYFKYCQQVNLPISSYKLSLYVQHVCFLNISFLNIVINTIVGTTIIKLRTTAVPAAAFIAILIICFREMFSCENNDNRLPLRINYNIIMMMIMIII